MLLGTEFVSWAGMSNLQINTDVPSISLHPIIQYSFPARNDLFHGGNEVQELIELLDEHENDFDHVMWWLSGLHSHHSSSLLEPFQQHSCIYNKTHQMTQYSTTYKVHVYWTHQPIKVVQCVSVPMFKGILVNDVESRLQKGTVHNARG